MTQRLEFGITTLHMPGVRAGDSLSLCLDQQRTRRFVVLSVNVARGTFVVRPERWYETLRRWISWRMWRLRRLVRS